MRFAILREDFSSVLVSDLMTPNVSTKLMQYRHENWLKTIVATSSEEDRESIATSMPLVVIDYHVQRHNFQEACRVALLSRSYSEADSATTAFLNDTQLKWNPDKVVKFAETLVQLDTRTVLSSPTPSVFLRTLFQSPKQIPASLRSECVRCLGKDVFLLAFDRSSLNQTDLLSFSTSMFKVEVESALVSHCGPNAIDAVMWYDRNGHPSLASDFARERIDHWSNDDLFRISINLWTRPKWLLQKLKERHLLKATLPLVLLSPFISNESKKQFLKSYHLFEGRKQIALEDVASKCRRDLPAVLAQMTASGQLLEVVFLQMHLHCDTETKMRCSLKALETYHLAGLNIAGLLRLWEEGKQHNGAEMPTITAATFEEKFSFLMCVFFGDEPTDARRNLYANNQDQFSSLLLAFGPTVATYCKIHHSDKTRSQDDGLSQRLVAFHKELTSRVRKRHLQATAPNRLKGSEAASGENTHDDASDSAEEQEGGKPLSKKAARKQKQAARKKQAQNNGQVAQNSAAGKGKKNKKQNNKKQNNKKKRGRK